MNTPSAERDTPQDAATIERRARRFWVSMIVGLLGTQVAIGAASVYLAVSDPTVAIIPNYYQAGLDWDVKHRALDLMTSLGWKTEIEVGQADTTANDRPVSVRIVDREGNSVSGLRIFADMYHHARGNEIFSVQLHEDTPGTYTGITRLAQAGLWQFDMRLEGEHGIAVEESAITVR